MIMPTGSKITQSEEIWPHVLFKLDRAILLKAVELESLQIVAVLASPIFNISEE